MNNTSQINPSIYGCYYIHPSLDLFALYLRTPEGDVEYTNYDLFTADDKTIIAFKTNQAALMASCFKYAFTAP